MCFSAKKAEQIMINAKFNIKIKTKCKTCDRFETTNNFFHEDKDLENGPLKLLKLFEILMDLALYTALAC